MQITVRSFIKTLLSFSIGILVVFLFVKDLDQDSLSKIKGSVQSANYWWLIASILITLLSHYIRTIRWQQLLSASGHPVSFKNAFSAIMINYLVNLGIPRAGELARCVSVSRTEQVPLTKSVATLINERMIDLVLLFVAGLMTFLLQFNIFQQFNSTYILPKIKTLSENRNYILIVASIVILICVGGYYLLAKKLPWIKGKALELKSGLLSIFKLEKPGFFILYSLLIWICYWGGIYLNFFSLSETSSLPPAAALSILFFGTFGFLAVQGGLGSYPAIVGIVVTLYGLERIDGFTMGWLLWLGHTLLIIILGLLSFVMISINKNQKIT